MSATHYLAKTPRDAEGLLKTRIVPGRTVSAAAELRLIVDSRDAAAIPAATRKSLSAIIAKLEGEALAGVLEAAAKKARG